MLPINTLLKDPSSKEVSRVLALVASKVHADHTASYYALISVHAARAMPYLHAIEHVHDRVGRHELVVIEEVFDPVDLEHLSKRDRELTERRWRLVRFVLKRGPLIWDETARGRLARRLAHFKVCSKPFFYDVLRRYWQRGQTKEALVTDLCLCGAPGVLRIPSPGAPKTGRKRTIQPGTGVAATEEHRRNMSLAWMATPVSKDGRNLRRAWEWMLIRHYPEHVTPIPQSSDGHTIRVDNYDAVPTFEQFEYHWKQEYPFDIRQLKRLRQRRFDLAFKPLTTGTLQEVRGPGTRYYIDATVLDVYVVSRWNPRRVVSRPTLYVVVDQFSRMIVGMYIGLEPPSWAGAMLALWNCSIDKVAYCRRFGIEIRPEQWPTGYMPLHLMGDRAELISSDADRLGNGFNLDVENARAFAGDAKGVGERKFKTTQAIFGPFVPGYIDKELAGRDAEPAILRSALTFEAITRVIINSVVIANTHVVREYEGWPEVIADGTPFVPVSLWQWGVENLRADFRQFPEQHLVRYLWPKAEMTTTRRGLQFMRGLYYMGDAVRERSWFTEAVHRGTRVQAFFHPEDNTQAVVLLGDQQVTPCDVSLVKRSQRFGGATLSEYMALVHQKERQNALAEWANLGDRLARTKSIAEDSATSRRAAEKAKPPGETKVERTRDLRSAREAELALQAADVVARVTARDTPEIVPPPALSSPEEERSATAVADQSRAVLEELRRQRGTSS